MPDISSEAIFVLIFLLISFVSWISEKLKAGRKPGRVIAPQRREPLGEAEPPDFPTAPRQRQERPQTSQPDDTMREILKSLGIPVEEEPVPAPPPLPEAPRPPSLPLEEAPAMKLVPKPVDPEALVSRKQLAARRRKKRGAYGISEHHAGHPVHTALQLLKPKNVQAALVLKEILDKPKGLDH